MTFYPETETAIRADQMHRISEIDDKRPAPGLYVTLHDDEAADRKKAPAMSDAVKALALYLGLLAVVVFLASLYAGWQPDVSQLWPRLVAWAAI